MKGCGSSSPARGGHLKSHERVHGLGGDPLDSGRSALVHSPTAEMERKLRRH